MTAHFPTIRETYFLMEKFDPHVLLYTVICFKFQQIMLDELGLLKLLPLVVIFLVLMRQRAYTRKTKALASALSSANAEEITDCAREGTPGCGQI